MSGDTIRQDFAEMLSSDDRTEIVAALKGFVTAGKVAHFECKKCGSENDVEVPDAKVRLDTLKFMVDQGLGALLKEAPRTSVDALIAQHSLDMDSLTDHELSLLILHERESKGEVGFSDPKVDAYEAAKWVIADYPIAQQVVAEYERAADKA